MTKEQRQWNLIWEFIILIFFLLAFFLAIREGLKIDWWGVQEVLPICIMVAAFVAVSGYNEWLITGGCILGILAEGSVLCFNLYGLQQEFKYYCHHVLRLVNEYYETTYRYQTRLKNGDVRMFLFAAALPVGALLGLWIHGRKDRQGGRQWWRVFFLFPLVIAFASGLLLGYEPGIWSVLCAVSGLAFRLLLGDGSVMRQRRNIQVFLCACAAIGLSVLCYIPASGKMLEYHKTWNAFQATVEDSVKNIMNGSSLWSEIKWHMGLYDDTAKLTNRAPRMSDEKIFSVTVTKKPADALYFKTFVGGDYDKGIWYEADEKAFEAYCQKMGLDSQELGMYALDQASKGMLAISYWPSSWDMTVQILKRNSKLSPYPYYPYGVSFPEGAKMIGDSGICVSSGSSYQLTMVPDQPYSSIKEIYLPFKETEYAKVYQDYVEEFYTHLPEGQLQRLREAYENGYFDHISSSDFKYSGNYQYSFDLDPVPEGEDVIEYFILDSCEGYCMHFASAATILYRLMGIPARYVSGYVVSPNEFVENEDGTYTAVVTGKRAHAWTEVYSEQWGWICREETPPTYSDRFLNAEPGESQRDIANAIAQESQPSVHPVEQDPEPDNTPDKKPDVPVNNTPKTPTNQEDTTEPGSQDQEKPGRGGIFGLGIGFRTGNGAVDTALTVTVYILSAALILGLILLLFFLRRHFIWRRRDRSFQEPDDKKAALAIVRQTFQVLLLLDIVFTGKEDEIAFANETEGKLSCMKEGDFVEFIEIAQAARYGSTPLTEGQRKYLLMIYKRLRLFTAEQLNWARRIWYRYVVVRI